MTKRPRPPHHNHTTRDIKPLGECPACDGYHAQNASKGRSTPNPLQTKIVGAEQPDPRIEAASRALLEVSKRDLPEGMYEKFDDVSWEVFEKDAVAMLAAADAVDPLRQPSITSPDCRDANHHKCHGDAWDEAHDHITECQCACHAPSTPGPDGFIGIDMTGLLPGHICVRPRPGYPLGVIWKCLLCNAAYRVESVRDRGISQNEWAPYEVTP